MNQHFLVAADQQRIRVYGETNAPGCFLPRTQLVASIELDTGHHAYSDRALAVRSAFARSSPRPAPSAQVGRRDDVRRRAKRLAAALAEFLQQHPHASWDLAAEPVLFQPLVDAVSADVRRRLKRVYSNELLTDEARAVGSRLATA